jgi:hypothetical protein
MSHNVINLAERRARRVLATRSDLDVMFDLIEATHAAHERANEYERNGDLPTAEALRNAVCEGVKALRATRGTPICDADLTRR